MSSYDPIGVFFLPLSFSVARMFDTCDVSLDIAKLSKVIPLH